MIIEAKNIFKSYKHIQVLKDLNFSMEKGEIISLCGASGAGKTSLLQIIGSLDQPDSGELFYNNKNISKLKPKELSQYRNKEIGFIFQFHHLLSEFSALENICLPALIAKKDKAEIEKRAHKLLQFLNLDNRAHHRPNELSGGEQQRVAVARALINEPELILADEPSGNLDTKHAQELHQLFFKLREEFGHSFLIVTHNENLAKISDRCVQMQDGQIL